MSYLELKDIQYKYPAGASDVVNLSLQVVKGESIALMGPNGAGKSTLFSILSGFICPQQGSILIEGQSIGGVHPSLRPIASIFQSDNLFEHLTVYQNLQLGIPQSKQDNKNTPEAINHALQYVGLEGMQKRRPGELSGGEQQKLVLARILLSDKPILLLDEPFSALDIVAKDSLLDLLVTVKQQKNLTILFVTHNEEDAHKLGTRLINLEQGRIISDIPLLNSELI